MKSKPPPKIQKKVLLREIEELDESGDCHIHSLARLNRRKVSELSDIGTDQNDESNVGSYVGSNLKNA
jgi:hypothetical protein